MLNTYDKQYYVINSHSHAAAVLEWIYRNNVEHELHLNRTRFTVNTDSELYTEFCLRWADVCAAVEESQLLGPSDC